MFPDKNTKTRETEIQYTKRSLALVRKAKIEMGIPFSEAIDPRQFVAWLAKSKTNLSRSSWRQYKSAVIFHLGGSGGRESQEAIDWLREVDVDGCQKKTGKTSGTKLKKLNFGDFHKITEYLRKNNGKWHAALLDWMVSGTLTGLRPQEWHSAEISSIGGEPALIVENAKKTNGRAHGPQRTLLLGQLAVEEVDTIRRHIQRIREFSGVGQYLEIYEGCSHTLHYVCRKLWPRRTRHITLYSCRHQFSANAKASGFSREEIAAMMGHAVDDTASRHYGKKTAGEELVRVRALQEEVDRIIQKERSEWAKRREPKPSIRKPLHGMPQENLSLGTNNG